MSTFNCRFQLLTCFLNSKQTTAGAALHIMESCSTLLPVTGHETQLSILVDTTHPHFPYILFSWQVTKDGTTHLVFHPSPDELILAAADKQGYVSIWRPDEAESGASRGAGRPARSLQQVFFYSVQPARLLVKLSGAESAPVLPRPALP